jgi:plastocyanin
MSQLPVRSLRLRSFTTTDLDRLTGDRGAVFYDGDLKTLKIYNGGEQAASVIAKNDLTNVSNTDFLAKATAAGFSGGVQAGVAGRIAYYPSSGSQVNDLTELTWTAGTSTLALTGTVDVTGQKNKIRFHWDTLADLNAEVPAVDWHGMVAHAHDTGKLYYAHAGAWVPVASEAMVAALGVNYQFFVAADDSTQRLISTDEVIKFTGVGGITTSSDAEGAITISGAAVTGSVTFVGTTIDSVDSSAITFTPSVVFDSDITVGTDIVFPDGTRQSTSAVGIPGPKGDQGDPGASGAGSGDVLSAGGGYVDNRIVRYDGATGTIIQVSSASISDAGLLTATSFSGAGSLITALNATELTSGTIPDARFPATLPTSSGTNLTALNATQLTSGTVPDARFPATLPAVSGVNLTALPATLPAASGVNLTALNATQLTSGTVPIGRIGASGTPSASTFLRGDNVWAAASGGSASDSFSTITVAGQSNVVADSATDTLTLVAGSNITITTDAGTDTITIAAAGGGSTSDSFATIAVAGQTSVIADSSTDTLTLAAGTGISITTNASTDTVTITSTVSAGATALTGLTDASAAGLTVDEFALPAITRLDVSANGSSAYRFDQYSTTDNPTIYAISGTTIAFNLASLGNHPFLIRYAGANYSTGLVHVSTGGTVLTGASALGQTTGTLYWKIPASISGTYGYLCSIHGGMAGNIEIKAISAI